MILICCFAAQETFLISINDDNISMFSQIILFSPGIFDEYNILFRYKNAFINFDQFKCSCLTPNL